MKERQLVSEYRRLRNQFEGACAVEGAAFTTLFMIKRNGDMPLEDVRRQHREALEARNRVAAELDEVKIKLGWKLC